MSEEYRFWKEQAVMANESFDDLNENLEQLKGTFENTRVDVKESVTTVSNTIRASTNSFFAVQQSQQVFEMVKNLLPVFLPVIETVANDVYKWLFPEPERDPVQFNDVGVSSNTYRYQQHPQQFRSQQFGPQQCEQQFGQQQFKQELQQELFKQYAQKEQHSHREQHTKQQNEELLRKLNDYSCQLKDLNDYSCQLKDLMDKLAKKKEPTQVESVTVPPPSTFQNNKQDVDSSAKTEVESKEEKNDELVIEPLEPLENDK